MMSSLLHLEIIFKTKGERQKNPKYGNGGRKKDLTLRIKQIMVLRIWSGKKGMSSY